MNLPFLAPKKKQRSFHQKQVINEALMEKMHQGIRELRAKEMDFKDVSQIHFNLSNTYEPVPTEYGRGVLMRLCDMQRIGEAKRVQIKYQPQGEMFPKFCNNCVEVIKVINGSITDKMINETYTQGQVFILKRGTKHHLTSKGGAELLAYLVSNNYYLPYVDELQRA